MNRYPGRYDRPDRPTRPFEDDPRPLSTGARLRRRRLWAALPPEARIRAVELHAGDAEAIIECPWCTAAAYRLWLRLGGAA